MTTPAVYEINCDIQILEIVHNTIDQTLSPIELTRNIITVPAEGYNWVSPNIAYYKSSGLSNAARDETDDNLVRQYMWFPTIGLVQENSLMDLMFKINNNKKINGFIIKNILPDLYKLGFVLSEFPPFARSVLNDTFTSYNKYFMSPYAEFLYGNTYNSANQTNANAEIHKFINFIFIMAQYCYNWKQIQYSVRLSINNIIDGVSLSDSKFKNICNFILSHDLENEFSKTPSWKRLETPLLPILVTYAQKMRRIEEALIINDLLSGKKSVNNALIITLRNPDISKDEIKMLITPFKNTIGGGVPLNEETMTPPQQVAVPLTRYSRRSVKKSSTRKKTGSKIKIGGKRKISKSKKYKKQKKGKSMKKYY